MGILPGITASSTTRMQNSPAHAGATRRQSRASLQIGNCEWITLLACVCADGSTLPPGLIYQAAGKAVQSSWVESIDPRKHSEHFTTSPSGWTNDDVGLAWLEQVFDRYTKTKARRKYRLLIVDGHGSHLTIDFISTATTTRYYWPSFLHIQLIRFNRWM